MWGTNQNEKINDVLKRFMRKYIENEKSPDKKPVDKWLFDTLKEELPEESDEELKRITDELLEGIDDHYQRKAEIERYRKFGVKPVEYLTDEIIDSVEIIDGDTGKTKDAMREMIQELEEINEMEIYRGAAIKEPELVGSIIGINKIEEYVDHVSEVIDAGNNRLLNKVFNRDGTINQNPNLDGFIFEHEHANTFNIDAAVKNKSVKATVIEPEIGESYGRNSVDIKVTNVGEERALRKYQAKAYKDSKVTSESFEKGDYRGQRKLVPDGQEVEGAVNKIEYDGVESKPISKEEIKRKQEAIQRGEVEKELKSFKNDADTRVLARQIGRQALTMGTISMGVSMALSTGKKLMAGEEIEVEEVIVDGLKAGGTVGLSTAVAGGMKVALEKEMVTGKVATFLSKNNIIATIAASSVGIVSTIFQVGSGDITIKDGVKRIGTTMAATYAGIIGYAKVGAWAVGTAIKIGVISSVASVMAPVVAFAAGTIGAVAGSKIAETLVSGAMSIGNAVVDTAVEIVKGGAEVVKTVASGVVEGIKTVGSAIVSGISSVCSGIASFFGF